jgi:serine/threonine protein kinase/Flp pilus assembly protein TadD
VATTPAKRACSVCGTPLADDSPYCPVCALQQALGTQSYSDSNESSELRFGHYQILRNQDGKAFELGHGGMGVTYKAIDTHLRCPVALKIIRAQFIGNEAARSRFLREARAAASVHHSNVATVHHLGESGGNYFYAMEFVDGETLEKLIHGRGRLEVELALEILTHVAAGLTSIHKQHLVHRDIKPSNIMLTWEESRLENVKIIDLGLAKGVTEDTLSIAGSFIGTPTYASPEQFAGFGTDIRSDLYSLGVTLWEMLSGKPPFHGSAAELMDQHQHAGPPFEKLKSTPGPVMALVQVLLAKDPNQRFQAPAQLQRALTRVREAVSSGSKLSADELTSAELVAVKSSHVKPKKQTVRWVVSSGLCVAALAVAWFFFFGRAAFLFNQPANKSIPGEKSIAVLPFENISPNKDDAYFADGVQDEILNNLAKIAQLKVSSRTSVMQYRGDNNRDLRQIAAVLGVAHVLEGAVRRDGNHVRVSTELVDARNDSTIWADSYDRNLSDIFAIQSEIAQNIVTKLGVRFSSEEKQEIQRKPTENLQAYELYLRAKASITNSTLSYEFSVNRQTLLDDAIALLEQAVRLDPTFALAYCQIAFADQCLYAPGLDATPERLRHYDNAVREALRVNPNLPEAHLAAGYYFYDCCRDYEQARAHLTLAESLLPNNSETHILAGYIDRGQGRWADSTKASERACNLDPENPGALINLACNYEYVRQYRNEERIYDRLIALQPDNQILKLQRAMVSLYEKADVSQWRTALEALPSSLQNEPDMLVQRIVFFVLSRDWVKARELVRSSSSEELPFGPGATIPRRCWEIPIAKHLGEHPETNPEFIESRDKLQQKVREHPKDPLLLAFLGLTDSYLGRNQEAIDEAKSAADMSKDDGIVGPGMMTNLAIVYARANETNLAFQVLNISIKTPAGITYGDLRLDPDLDSLRADPRFDKLLAELAPRD